MTPLVDGKVHSFETRGLYDGLSILWDAETGTIWNHITGVGLDGPLAGRRLGPIGNLIHTTVEAALDADPDTRVAISERPIARETRWAALAEKVPALMPLFRNTMGREDTRRPTMDVGLGVWSDEEHARYYPLDAHSTTPGAEPGRPSARSSSSPTGTDGLLPFPRTSVHRER